MRHRRSLNGPACISSSSNWFTADREAARSEPDALKGVVSDAWPVYYDECGVVLVLLQTGQICCERLLVALVE